MKDLWGQCNTFKSDVKQTHSHIRRGDQSVYLTCREWLGAKAGVKTGTFGVTQYRKLSPPWDVGWDSPPNSHNLSNALGNLFTCTQRVTPGPPLGSLLGSACRVPMKANWNCPLLLRLSFTFYKEYSRFLSICCNERIQKCQASIHSLFLISLEGTRRILQHQTQPDICFRLTAKHYYLGTMAGGKHGGVQTHRW